MGSLNCLNNLVSPKQREAFVKRCQQLPLAENAQIDIPVAASPTPALTYHNPAPQAPLENLATAEGLNHFNYQQHLTNMGFDKIYEEFEEHECTPISVPISTVHVKLDQLAKGRLLVPVSFKDSNGALFPATALIDTGAMANFVNEGFI
jgi:hypothetical protein